MDPHRRRPRGRPRRGTHLQVPESRGQVKQPRTVIKLTKTKPALTAAVCCIAVFLAGCAAESGYQSTDASTVRIPLARSKEHKLILRATAPGGDAWVELDTGAPVTCADETKAALFRFQKFPRGAPTLILNGEHHRMGSIPQLEFGGVTVKNFAVAMVDLGNLNQSLQRDHDRANDAILGLDALHALHGVIDCGSRRLFLRPGSGSGNAAAANLTAAGWRAVPMRLIDQHPVVPVTVNGTATLFLVDTGAPFSAIDAAWSRGRQIPVRTGTFAMKAIHYETRGAQVGHIHDLKIGGLDLGQMLVGVFDLTTLVGGKNNPSAQTVTGLLGSQTLERLEAVIDCDAMLFYIREPDSVGGLEF